ncbi:MAG: cell envelope biogenesis protein OmpA [Micavibrio sp.]|nr:cell envelope biogenesis protein OmpA [Micavibrio sp.]
MRHKNYLTLALVAVMLTACGVFQSDTEMEALSEAQAVGSPFTQHLTDGYREFSNMNQERQKDYADGLHFARKGLVSAKGHAVLPEPISDWNVRTEDVNELQPARARLISALNRGGREIAPQLAATAQVKYDCWIEQEEENWYTPENVTCKSEFMQALNALEAQVGAAPEVAPAPDDIMPPVAAVDVDDAGPMQIEDAKYLVFFDFDQSNIADSGSNVLNSVTEEIRANNVARVKVIGHTDASGSNSYNEALAMRRANSVRDALIQRGVPAENITVESRGETQLMVQTPDGVREPANRRVEVSFE